MTRITYKRTEDNILISKVLKSFSEEYIVNIIDETHWIICTFKGIFVIEGIEKSLQNAKKAAKKALIQLGIKFENEVRPRIKNNEGTKNKEEILKLYQNSIMEDNE